MSGHDLRHPACHVLVARFALIAGAVSILVAFAALAAEWRKLAVLGRGAAIVAATVAVALLAPTSALATRGGRYQARELDETLHATHGDRCENRESALRMAPLHRRTAHVPR